MNTQKVVQLYDNKLYEDIMIFLNEMGIESEHTRKAYETDIRQFFKLIKGKELEYLTLEDIQLKKRDVELFKQILLENGLARSTINRKISAVRSLLENLKANEWDVKTAFFKNIKWLKVINNRRGVLEVHEVKELARLALETERENKEIKYYLILFALDTGMRKSALLNLKWSDFEVNGDEVVINYYDKGKKEFNKEIAKWFYDELLSIKQENEERVFPISKDSVDDMMKRLIKIMGIPKERKITFHSIRACAITHVYRIKNGDIIAAKEFAGHSNMQTTDRYVKRSKLGAIGAVSSIGNLDDDLYKKVTNDELVKAIENCPKDVQLMINIQLKEIINNKNRQ
jgi:integrase